MKRLLELLIFSMAGLFAQTQPNCSLAFGPWTTNNQTATQANTSIANQCAYWIVSYQVTGTPTISIQFEGATGAVAPGTFAAFQGTTVSGSNPSTSTTCSTVTNCVAVFSGYIPWYRVTITLTGTGTVSGTLQGYKTYQAGGGNTPVGAGCVGTVAVPCVVAGPGAAGSAVGVTGPVQVSGSDGTNVRRILTDTSGRTQEVGAAADGAAVAGNPVLVGGSDGTNAQSLLVDTAGRANVVGAAAAGAAPVGNPVLTAAVGSGATGGLLARPIVCDRSASILYSAAMGTVELVALSASQIIYVCDVNLASDTVTNVTLEYGTGVTCGTGTTALFNALQNVLAMSLSFSAAVRTAASNALCIVSSTTATIGGVVTYAQF